MLLEARIAHCISFSNCVLLPSFSFSVVHRTAVCVILNKVEAIHAVNIGKYMRKWYPSVAMAMYVHVGGRINACAVGVFSFNTAQTEKALNSVLELQNCYIYFLLLPRRAIFPLSALLLLFIPLHSSVSPFRYVYTWCVKTTK